jgi:hypothetical protein
MSNAASVRGLDQTEPFSPGKKDASAVERGSTSNPCGSASLGRPKKVQSWGIEAGRKSVGKLPNAVSSRGAAGERSCTSHDKKLSAE